MLCAAPSRPARLTGQTTPARQVTVLAVNAVVAALILAPLSRAPLGVGRYHIDLDVYRIGARAWWHGVALYGPLPATRVGVGLPFTYPPFAAVLFTPLAAVPYGLAALVITAAGILGLAFVLWRFVSLVPGYPDARAARVVGVVLPVALLLEPVRATLRLGQVNVLLMALVTADCLLPSTRWRRGVLVGLAASIKLTPIVFVAFFLLRRDRRSAATAVGSFIGFGLLGLLLAPADSMTYWTRAVFDPDRIGGLAYAGNQSITGILARLGMTGTMRSGVALALGVVVVLVALRGMQRAVDAGQPALAVALNAIAGLLISPVSWSHHWVWLEPTLLYLLLYGRNVRAPRLVGATAAGLLVVAIAPQWRLPNTHDRELHWAAWEQVVGSPYAVLATVLLVTAAIAGAGRGIAVRG